MTTLLNGLLGGVVVGVLAAVATELVDDVPSATASRLGSVLGDPARVSGWWEFALRSGYGVAATLLLYTIELFVLGFLAVPPTRGESVALAAGWSAVLFVVLAVAYRIGLSRTSSQPYVRELLAYHLVYAVGLALWIRLTWIT